MSAPAAPLNCDTALEAAVLGTVLSESRLAGEMLQIITKPAVFSLPLHRHVFECIVALYDRQEEIDIITVAQEATRRGHGETLSFAVVTDIAGQGRYYSRLGQQCQMLFELAVKRYLARWAQGLVAKALDPTTDALALLSEAGEGIDTMLGQLKSMGEKSAGQYLVEHLEDLERRQKEPQSIGIRTGIRSLDEAIGGFEKGNLVVIGAETGGGKTAFSGQIIRHNTLGEKRSVGLISLEMTGKEVMARHLGAVTGVSNFEQKRGEYNLSHMCTSALMITDMSLHIWDRPGMSLPELKLKAVEWVRRHGIEVLIVDYLQLVSVDGAKDETAAASKVSRMLKNLAGELGIVVIALSQLSRAFASRNGWDKRPRKSDLRQTGQIEQDANYILLLFNPWDHGLQYDDGTANERTLEVAVAKARSSPPTHRENPVILDYDKAINTVTDRRFRPGQLPIPAVPFAFNPDNTEKPPPF